MASSSTAPQSLRANLPSLFLKSKSSVHTTSNNLIKFQPSSFPSAQFPLRVECSSTAAAAVVVDEEMDKIRRLQNGSDVRGVALDGEKGRQVDLTPPAVEAIAESFGEWVAGELEKERGAAVRVSLGRDPRISGPGLSAAVFAGLARAACEVFDMGLATTPACFMSTLLPPFSYDASMMMTASHLPYTRNGLKFFTKKGGLTSPQVEEICDRAARKYANRLAKVHLEYLEAGADILVTSSYQATIPGFLSRGLSMEEAESLLTKSVKIAAEARDKFCASIKLNPENNHNRALIAASIGSYGAYLADGSEYSGNYGPTVTLEKLKDFHRRRLQVLVEAGPDLLAFETIPNKLEAQACVELLDEENVDIPSWICFSSVDGINAPSGESFEDCLRVINKSNRVCAVGINCAPPHFVLSLIQRFKELTGKAIVVHPNSGEIWDGIAKRWLPSKCFDDEKFEVFATQWRDAGAKLIGGCCRTTPSTVRRISQVLKEKK